MTRHIDFEMRFDLPPERLVGVMTDPAFLEWEAVQQGSFRATCVDQERTEQRVSLRLDQVGPNHDPRTRAKETRFSIHYDWDVAAGSCEWHRTAERDDGVRIGGRHRITAQAGGSRYTMHWELTIGIPVLGRVMEKKVDGEIRKGAQRRERFLRQWLAEHPG